MKRLYFIDLFAGAGGLSEGFIRAGFTPLAHVEMDKYACDTLRTRAAFHYLKNKGKLDAYRRYLLEKREKEDGSRLWAQVPREVIEAVIQSEIGVDTLKGIFSRIDAIRGGREVDLIVGGPPCQAYSSAGRARMGKKVESDPRNELYRFYVEFLRRYRPRMFVFENVLGIKTAKNGEPFRALNELVKESGYQIECREQIASEHGVLQRRHRMIIVGWRNDCGHLHYPELVPEPNEFSVMKDLFSDLPERKAGEGKLCEPVFYTRPLEEMNYLRKAKIRGTFDFTTQHIARPHNLNDREIYVQAINCFASTGKQLRYTDIDEGHQKHKNKETFLNRFSVVNPAGVCHTVVAHIAMDGHYYIYPTPNPTTENVRSITVREAARLQSFPDDYYFEGSRSSAFKQIGNAVPVVMAEAIAKDLWEQLKK